MRRGSYPERRRVAGVVILGEGGVGRQDGFLPGYGERRRLHAHRRGSVCPSTDRGSGVQDVVLRLAAIAPLQGGVIFRPCTWGGAWVGSPRDPIPGTLDGGILGVLLSGKGLVSSEGVLGAGLREPVGDGWGGSNDAKQW